MASRRSIDNVAEELKSLSLRSTAGGGGGEILEEEDEAVRFANVRRKDFMRLERVRGRLINILEGLELHTGVFSVAEQRRIVDCIYEIQEKGRKGRLRDRTYSEPRKWMRGKGRITIQFGCCYNYALDSNGNPPGIIRNEEVDDIPPLLKQMIKRSLGIFSQQHASPTAALSTFMTRMFAFLLILITMISFDHFAPSLS